MCSLLLPFSSAFCSRLGFHIFPLSTWGMEKSIKEKVHRQHHTILKVPVLYRPTDVNDSIEMIEIGHKSRDETRNSLKRLNEENNSRSSSQEKSIAIEKFHVS